MVCKGVFNQVIWKKKRELHEAYLTRNWIKVKPFWYARNLCGNYEKRLSYLEIFFWISYQSEVGRNVLRESQEIESRLMVWWPEGVFKSHEWF